MMAQRYMGAVRVRSTRQANRMAGSPPTRVGRIFLYSEVGGAQLGEEEYGKGSGRWRETPHCHTWKLDLSGCVWTRCSRRRSHPRCLRQKLWSPSGRSLPRPRPASRSGAEKLNLRTDSLHCIIRVVGRYAVLPKIAGNPEESVRFSDSIPAGVQQSRSQVYGV